jgi:4-hydroxy-tetrahydrodipicolinate synthase
MSIFTGAGVAIVTPFKEDLSVNYDKFGELIDYQIENGTDSIIVCGTTGEASTLSHEEHIECIRFVCEYTNKRVPVIAGTGSNSTDTAIYLTKEAKKVGADGLLVVTPYYNKATQKGLIGHFTDIALASDLPMVLYNIPGRTGCNIQPETAAYLCKNLDTIIAMKDATGNISQVAQTILECEGMLDLYSGNDDQIVPLLSLGGKGVISVLSNIAPRDTHDIVAKYLAGDAKESLKLQLKYLSLINALFCEVNPIPVKKAMNFMGFEVGTLRKPLTEMEDAHAEVLLKEMKNVGLIK